ncbi:MAG: hypothetical protein IJR95_04430 [Lachnospiraceae bacterium]|nr:hypothetical protein [Lachnospiraceae bacterium]
MKIVEIINRIGFVLLIPGPILLFWNAAGLAGGGGSVTWMILGGILTVLGLIMGNFKGELLYREEQ